MGIYPGEDDAALPFSGGRRCMQLPLGSVGWAWPFSRDNSSRSRINVDLIRVEPHLHEGMVVRVSVEMWTGSPLEMAASKRRVSLLPSPASPGKISGIIQRGNLIRISLLFMHFIYGIL